MPVAYNLQQMGKISQANKLLEIYSNSKENYKLQKPNISLSAYVALLDKNIKQLFRWK